MKAMHSLQQSVRFSGPVVLALVATVGCSRPFETTVEGAARPSQAPLSAPAGTNPASQTPDLTPVANAQRQQSLPFQPSQEVPAGTLLTVRLQTPITVRVPIMEDAFEAVIDRAVEVNGNTLIPTGTSVAGHVESVFVSQMEPRRGYVGLELDSVRLGDANIPLQTSNLFARQTSSRAVDKSAVRLERGHRLTFRLTEPISIIFHSTQASR